MTDDENEDTPTDRTVVHILRHGFPLCGFTSHVPKDWPKGHAWVRLNEPGSTCAACIERGKEIEE